MKKMTKGMLMTALICGAVYLGGSPVYANELQEFALDEYVVTAARTETKLVDTPANISVVDAQTIEERHYQDVSEVLKDVPGATVTDDGMGVSEKIVRLNGDERVLFLVDGRRINTDMGLTGAARASVDMKQLPDVSLIERVEILKGAGGALYGSDAVGGVVNIITKKADINYGKVSIATGSFNTKDMSAMYSFKKNNTGVTIAASKYEQDYAKYENYADGKTNRWPGDSSYENEKVSLKVDQALSDYNNLSIGYDCSKSEGFTASSITYVSPAYLEKNTENISVKFDWKDASQNDGFIQYYHNKLDYSNTYSDWLTGAPLTATLKETTDGIDVQQSLAVAENNKLVFGASYRKSKAENPDLYTSEESIDNIAFFVSDNWQLGNDWTLNTGVRYDNHSEAGSDTTMSAGLNKKFDDYSHAYVNWSQVFKAPNMDDLYSNSPFMGIGNTDLSPETGDTWSIGYQTKLNDKTGVGINYFESDLEDAIYWNYIEYPAVVYNVDKQKKEGLELNLTHEINEHLDFEASYTYLKVKNSKDGGTLERDNNVIPNMYRFGIKYHKEKLNMNMFLRAGSGADTSRYLDSNYVTVDCAITYDATKDLTLYAKAYNLFNEAYAEHGGYSGNIYSYPAQSRRFIVGAEYKF